MNVYLVQHAKATSKEIDPKRPLSEMGTREMRKVAAFIKPLNLKVDYLWHSEKTRAIQTANTLKEAIKINKVVNSRNDIGPTDDVTKLAKELQSATDDIMIVGHLPFLSKLASLLLTGSESANIMSFKNAGIVCINRSDEKLWQIEWIITPEIIA
jgi:phosphohistidine phosphatase